MKVSTTNINITNNHFSPAVIKRPIHMVLKIKIWKPIESGRKGLKLIFTK
jgi:hypothetical protein